MNDVPALAFPAVADVIEDLAPCCVIEANDHMGAYHEERHDPKAGHADSFVHPAEQDRIVEVVFDFEIANLDLRIRRPGLVKK